MSAWRWLLSLVQRKPKNEPPDAGLRLRHDVNAANAARAVESRAATMQTPGY
jgi:hypothetical protein